MEVPAVKTPLFVNPPRKVMASLIVLFHVPLAVTIVRPVNIFVPDVLAKVRFPSIVEVPVTVMVVALRVFVVPDVTERFEPTLSIPVAEPLIVDPDSVKAVMP